MHSSTKLIAALLAGAGISLKKIRRAFREGFGEVEIKFDKSVVTKVDKAIEILLRSLYVDGHGFSRFSGEEFGEQPVAVGTLPKWLQVIVDPIDGTRPFINGDGNSTSIHYVYDHHFNEIVAAIIVKPSTGELWLAIDGQTKYYRYNDATETFDYVRDCHVQPINVTFPTVYVDCLHEFVRGGRYVFRPANIGYLVGALAEAGFGTFNNGSNGNHHALVANGNGSVAGSITLAIGGIQDLGGIAVVEGAGGYTAAFKLTDNRRLAECQPHDIGLNYDFLITAINEAVLVKLIAILRAALAAG